MKYSTVPFICFVNIMWHENGSGKRGIISIWLFFSSINVVSYPTCLFAVESPLVLRGMLFNPPNPRIISIRNHSASDPDFRISLGRYGNRYIEIHLELCSDP